MSPVSLMPAKLIAKQAASNANYIGMHRPYTNAWAGADMAETADLLHVMYKQGPPQFACPVLMQVTLPEEIKLIMIFNSFDLEII